MTTKEIITLQFGHYANFVGSHWWNIQELGFSYDQSSSGPSEINHDVLYREGKTTKNEITYTPRLLLVDLKGCLKSLPEHGTIYESPISPDKVMETFDDTPIETQVSQPAIKNSYISDVEKNVATLQTDYNLEKEVKVWSDFLYTRFHPRSVNIIQSYHHNDELTPFDLYPLGVSTWKSTQFEEDFSDKIRNYIEECDHNQGFQVLLDSTDGFSGLATSCIQYLKDEYDKKAIFALPLIPLHCPTKQKFIKSLNVAFTFDSLSENSSLFIPLSLAENGWKEPGSSQSFNHINYDPTLQYHTSAILASAVDTFTLTHRLKRSASTISDLCTDFNRYGRKCAAASLCMPFSLNRDMDFIECLDNWEGPLWKSITPKCSISTDRMLQHVTIRGIPESRLKKSAQMAGRQKNLPAYKCNSVKEMLDYYLNCTSNGSATNVTSVSIPLVVKSPYPNFFDNQIDTNGDIVHSATERAQSVRALSGIHSGSSVGDMLECLNDEIGAIKFAHLNQFKSAGMEQDEFNECVENLRTLRECYEETYHL